MNSDILICVTFRLVEAEEIVFQTEERICWMVLRPGGAWPIEGLKEYL